MLATQTHVLIRVKSDIRLTRIGGFLSDGSYVVRLSGDGAGVTMRVIVSGEVGMPSSSNVRAAI